MKYSKLSDYDYDLPEELIAQEPLEERDQSRMLVLNRRNEAIEHRQFFELPAYLQKGDLLVLNDTKVIPARLVGRIAGKEAEAELLLLRRLDNGNWETMVKPGRKLKPGTKVLLEAGNEKVEAVIEGISEEGHRLVSFHTAKDFASILPRLGQVPLPPYIRKSVKDPDQYQTIYAREDGSAAAPTAGFHFTPAVFTALEAKGVELCYITLHIGPGTFQPVKTENILDHKMHREYFSLGESAASTLNRTKSGGGRVIAVGTTACRVLESVVDEKGVFKPYSGWTGLYIYPGFRFRAVDAMVTNFHLPRSTLVMLVSALAGRDFILRAYREAVRERYRFFSFGDSMLIL